MKQEKNKVGYRTDREVEMTSIEQLAAMLRASDNIVFFGGAGVSTESNIPDFRSENGLYETESGHQYPPETILSHDFFMSHPKAFYDFYRKKMIYPDAAPNKAHLALARLEEMGKLKAVITQNIDGLHQMAGSKNVFELHGSIHKNYCMQCGKTFDLDAVVHSTDIPICTHCGGRLRPNVVLYGEGLDHDVIEGAVKAIQRADVLIIGGTSLVVYPAAGLVEYYTGSKLVLINRTRTHQDGRAALSFTEPIGEVLGQAIDML
jgi:NAD-dependent deacetylase